MTRPTAAVVVCTASHSRTALLHACVASLLAGTRVPDEILVVVDQNPSLKAELAGSLPAAVTLLETERQGNSEGRNTGILAATADVVAFVDDDAAVEREWLARLMEPFAASADVLGVGGAVVPAWQAGPRWLPEDLQWVVGCTYRGHRVDPGPIRNPIGCNMAFRRSALVAVGLFASEYGKRGDALVICDETELSLRLASHFGAGRIHYVPGARVHHVVPPDRISWPTLVKRCLSEGLSKGRLHRRYQDLAVSRERTYVRQLVLGTVPSLLVGGALRRDRTSLLGALAIVVSLVVTSAAFLAGLLLDPGGQAAAPQP